MVIKKIFISFAISLIIFQLFFRTSIASADDLVIQDDGDVLLIISNNSVLGTTTSSIAPTSTPKVNSSSSQPQPQHAEEKQQPSKQTSSSPQEKTVPLISPHTQAVVQINPPINNDKKLEVVITTQVNTPQVTQNTINAPIPTIAGNTKPISTSSRATQNQTVSTNSTLKNSSLLNSSNTNPASITKNVDQVIAQGSNGKPVIMIKSEKAHELTIQQGSTTAKTSLPLQIDTSTHSISVSSQNQNGLINVLPSEALEGVVNKGLITKQEEKKTNINLNNDSSGLNYTINSKEQGTLFGVFPVESNVEVKLSAKNGKITNVKQSNVFDVFGGFITRN